MALINRFNTLLYQDVVEDLRVTIPAFDLMWKVIGEPTLMGWGTDYVYEDVESVDIESTWFRNELHHLSFTWRWSPFSNFILAYTPDNGVVLLRRAGPQEIDRSYEDVGAFLRGIVHHTRGSALAPYLEGKRAWRTAHALRQWATYRSKSFEYVQPCVCDMCRHIYD